MVACYRVTTEPTKYECNTLALAGGTGGGSGMGAGPIGSRLLAGTSKNEIIELQVELNLPASDDGDGTGDKSGVPTLQPLRTIKLSDLKIRDFPGEGAGQAWSSVRAQ